MTVLLDRSFAGLAFSASTPDRATKTAKNYTIHSRFNANSGQNARILPKLTRVSGLNAHVQPHYAAKIPPNHRISHQNTLTFRPGSRSDSIPFAFPVTHNYSRFTHHDSRSPIPNSPFPIPDSRITIHDSRFTLPNSPFTILHSQSPFPTHDSRFTLPNSRFPIHEHALTLNSAKNTLQP